MFEVALINWDDDGVLSEELGNESTHPESLLIEVDVSIPKACLIKPTELEIELVFH